MTYFQDLQHRNLVHNHTPNLDQYLSDCSKEGKTPKVYCGFDPSGESLQIGNLMAILLLRRAQLHGVQPIILLGGATGLVGDPSGKKAERTLLAKSKAEENLEKIKQQILSFFDATPGTLPPLVVNNYDWFQQLNFVEFLRDVGKHITINYMIAKDSVKLRMETGISYAEFGYMLMQGYDYLHLYEQFGCCIQIGGSDQWGNITTGIELIRRKHAAEAHAASSPLLTDAAGNKLGKTENGAIYLNPQLTSPYKFYQYLLQVGDAEAPQLLKSLTFLSLAEIVQLEKMSAENPEKRDIQKRLAHEVTLLVHGAQAVQGAQSATDVLFSKDPAKLECMSKQGLESLASEVPRTYFDTLESVSLIDLLVKTGLASSKGEAKRHIQGGAITLNRQKATDEKMFLANDLFKSPGFLLLGMGKSQLHLVIRQNG